MFLQRRLGVENVVHAGPDSQGVGMLVHRATRVPKRSTAFKDIQKAHEIHPAARPMSAGVSTGAAKRRSTASTAPGTADIFFPIGFVEGTARVAFPRTSAAPLKSTLELMALQGLARS